MPQKKTLPLILLLALFCAGCEEDKETRPWYAPSGASVPSRESARTASGLIGTWELSGDGTVWYAHFLEGGAWRITDDRAGTKNRVHGSYTADDSSFQGDMTNPGVGTGSISGHYNGGSLVLDFVENWHSPAKHVSYAGRKL